MRKVKVEAAIGLAIAHDMTEVNVEKNIKQVAFRKRHVIQEGKQKKGKGSKKGKEKGKGSDSIVS